MTEKLCPQQAGTSPAAVFLSHANVAGAAKAKREVPSRVPHCGLAHSPVQLAQSGRKALMESRMEKLIGILGIALILGAAILMSRDRRNINWRLVAAGILLQALLAFLILKVPPVRMMFDTLGNGVQSLLDCAKEGAAFVFGDDLVKKQGVFVFAIIIGASIIFVGALTNLAYHWGILQRVVRALGFVLRKTMGVSGREGLSTGAEIFLGQVESQLLISRYIKDLSHSELLGVMSAAMATISGSALVAYVSLGIDPTYLLMASFMTAPSALVVAKIMCPESDPSVLTREAELKEERTSVNMIDALADGARQGKDVAVNVMVMLVAFIGAVYLVNKVLVGVGSPWTIQQIVGIAFTPVAWLIGIPWDEALRVGPLLGTKTILNEFIAYVDMSQMMRGDHPLSPRTLMITTVALCGFANLGSIAINIGGLTAMAPERKADIARMGFRALVAATMASWLTAALAGLFM